MSVGRVGPFPGARPQIAPRPDSGWRVTSFPSSGPPTACAVSLDMRRRPSAPAATTDPPLVPTLPTPKQACPSQGPAQLREGGAELGAARTPPAPAIAPLAGWLAVSGSPIHISSPLPSTGTLPPTSSHHSCRRTDMLASGSGKGRAKSLSGNDVICNVHCTGEALGFCPPTPSPPVLPVYPLSSLD